MKKKEFLYQVNTNRFCNLRCSHCYIDPKMLNSDHANFMPREKFLSVMRQIVEHQNSGDGYERAEIHVIGGEPTMIGYDYFNYVIPRAKEILKDVDGEVYFGIVSNLIDRNALDICKMFDTVCTSFEANTRFTKEALEKMWRGRAQELLASDVDINVNISVTNEACKMTAPEILDKLTDIGFREFYFGPFIPTRSNPASSSLLPPFKDTSKFMIDVADWYWEHKDSIEGLIVNPHDSMMTAFKEDSLTNYIACQIIAGSLDINWDGKTVTCTAEGGTPDANWLGNIFDKDNEIKDLLKKEPYKKEFVKAVRPKKECMNCDEYKICRSGCGLIFNFWDGTGECPGFKKFIKHMRAKYDEQVALGLM